MRYRTTAAILLVGELLAGRVFAQTISNPTQAGATPNPTQASATAQQDVVPVFRVTVVGHTTPAINYRPRKGDTTVDFTGTPLSPLAAGSAKVGGKKGYIDIDAKFDRLAPPSRFGPEYLTYVLWAITPEGRSTNLGEVQVKDDEAHIHVTTELQAFGMILTAEPYFAVTQPSDVVVMENSVRNGTKGNVDVIQAKFDLLKRGTYLMNQDSRQLTLKPLEPGAPLDLAEARNAVMLSRFAGADRHADDTYEKATRLLMDAEQAQARHRNGNEVMMPARQAVQTAEDARLISLQRQEDAAQAEQRAAAQQRESAALERARAEELARRQAEIDRLTAENARVAAERDKAAAEAAQRSAQALAEQAARDKAAAEAARAAAETQAQQARNDAASAEREKAELRDQLRQQLNQVLETRESARGLIVNLSDVLFDTASANLKPGAREKLAKVAGILLSHPGLKLQIEGHTDSVGAADYNQRLSESRADAVRNYLVGEGIASNAVGTAGFGETMPVASNDTATGRQQNRRVELVVSGDAIGTTSAPPPTR